MPAAKLRVAVSIAPQLWLVEQISREHVEVTAIVKPGESHETYQPTDAQIAQVMSGAVLFRIGIPFENGRAFLGMISHRKLRVVDTREGINLREMSPLERGGDSSHAGHSHEDEAHGHAHHDHEGQDPHVWLSPRLLKAQARTIAATLGEIDPAHRTDYERNLASLEQKLDAADGEIRRTLAPHRGKTFFVFHPAWGYFADDYGLKQVAIEAEGKEPSDKEATALQKMARQEGIKVVFVQPQIASRGAEAIAQAIGARLETLDPLAPDVLDNLIRAANAIAASYR
jgi:zinc transport system substrate-binding protein